VSDVERIAQTYSHTLRSDLIAELNRLRAALDEANTDRDREKARAEQNMKAALDYAAELGRLRALPARVVAAEAERDRALAQVQRVEALPDAWMRESNEWYYENRFIAATNFAEGFEEGWDHAATLLRAALAGEGSDDGA
jgi:hypothetical protein